MHHKSTKSPWSEGYQKITEICLVLHAFNESILMQFLISMIFPMNSKFHCSISIILMIIWEVAIYQLSKKKFPYIIDPYLCLAAWYPELSPSSDLQILPGQLQQRRQTRHIRPEGRLGWNKLSPRVSYLFETISKSFSRDLYILNFLQ